MHYHSNHMYCTQCHWTDRSYNSRHLVSIEKYRPYVEGVAPVADADWLSLVDSKRLDDNQSCPILKPHVLEWLNTNVTPPLSASDRKEDQWGWAMGNDDYRAQDRISYSLFFYRRRDAMSFIRTWSRHCKPTSYCNYFSDHRWNLDLETGKQVRT